MYRLFILLVVLLSNVAVGAGLLSSTIYVEGQLGASRRTIGGINVVNDQIQQNFPPGTSLNLSQGQRRVFAYSPRVGLEYLVLDALSVGVEGGYLYLGSTNLTGDEQDLKNNGKVLPINGTLEGKAIARQYGYDILATAGMHAGNWALIGKAGLAHISQETELSVVGTVNAQSLDMKIARIKYSEWLPKVELAIHYKVNTFSAITLSANYIFGENKGLEKIKTIPDMKHPLSSFSVMLGLRLNLM